MTTPQYNKARTDTWLKKFNEDESRIFLIVGMKQNGNFTFQADAVLTPLKIAEQLEGIAKAIRIQNINTH